VWQWRGVGPYEFEFLGLLGIEQVADAIVGTLMYGFDCVEAIDRGKRLIFVDVEQFGLAALEDDLYHALLSSIEIEAVSESFQLLIESGDMPDVMLGVRHGWLIQRSGMAWLILRGRCLLAIHCVRRILRSGARVAELETHEGDNEEERFSDWVRSHVSWYRTLV